MRALLRACNTYLFSLPYLCLRVECYNKILFKLSRAPIIQTTILFILSRAPITQTTILFSLSRADDDTNNYLVQSIESRRYKQLPCSVYREPTTQTTTLFSSSSGPTIQTINSALLGVYDIDNYLIQSIETYNDINNYLVQSIERSNNTNNRLVQSIESADDSNNQQRVARRMNSNLIRIPPTTRF